MVEYLSHFLLQFVRYLLHPLLYLHQITKGKSRPWQKGITSTSVPTSVSCPISHTSPTPQVGPLRKMKS